MQELGIYVIKKYLNNGNEKIIKIYGNGFTNKIHLHSVLKLFNGSVFEYIDFYILIDLNHGSLKVALMGIGIKKTQ